MGSADVAVVLAFNAAIKRRDPPGLGRLMADDHRFIDTAGDTFAGKPAALEAWRSFSSPSLTTATCSTTFLSGQREIG
jgi:hypothetical protein